LEGGKLTGSTDINVYISRYLLEEKKTMNTGTTAKAGAAATLTDATGGEAHESASFVQYAEGKVDDLFKKNIPVDDIKEIENRFWRTVLGLTACGIMLAVFVYFVYTSKAIFDFSLAQ
jgi:hypothetical protein